MAVANLSFGLTARLSNFLSGMDQARSSVGGFIATARTGFATLATGFVGQQIVGSVINIAGAVEQTAKQAQKLGLTVPEFQALSFAAEQSEVTTEALAIGMRRMARVAFDAVSGMREARATFADVGVSITDTQGRTKTQTQLLRDLAERFKAMPPGVRETALAVKFFGRSGTDLLPLLNEGAAGIAKLEARFTSLGISLSDNAGRAADEFGDRMAELQLVTRGLLTKAVLPLLTPLSEMVKGLAEGAAQSDAVRLAFDGITQALKAMVIGVVAIKNSFEIVGDILRSPIEGLMAIFQGKGFGDIANAFLDPLRDIKSDVADVGTAFDKLWGQAAGGGTTAGGGMLAANDVLAEGISESASMAGAQIDELIKGLELEALTFGKARTQVELYKLSLKGATGSQLEQAAAALQNISAMEMQKKQLEEGKRLFEQTRTPVEAFTAELIKLKALRLSGVIDPTTFERAVVDAFKQAREAGLAEIEQIRLEGQARQVSFKDIVVASQRAKQEVTDPQLKVTNALLAQLVVLGRKTSSTVAVAA